MIFISYLSDLTPGETAYINSNPSPTDGSALAGRLLELGAIEGTRVECIASAPFGGPTAYLIRGAVIALRPEDAREINVSRVPAESRLPIRLLGDSRWG